MYYRWKSQQALMAHMPSEGPSKPDWWNEEAQHMWEQFCFLYMTSKGKGKMTADLGGAATPSGRVPPQPQPMMASGQGKGSGIPEVPPPPSPPVEPAKSGAPTLPPPSTPAQVHGAGAKAKPRPQPPQGGDISSE